MQPVTTQQTFLTRVGQIRSTIDAVVENKKACAQVYHLGGEAVEFGMKAAIMRRKGLATLPTTYHTHDLGALLDILDVDQTTLPPRLRASLRTVLTWRRGNAYVDMQFSRAQARGFRDAAFGPNGVIPWLATL